MDNDSSTTIVSVTSAVRRLLSRQSCRVGELACFDIEKVNEARMNPGKFADREDDGYSASHIISDIPLCPPVPTFHFRAT